MPLTDEQDPMSDEPAGPCTACDEGWVTVAVDDEGNYLGPNPNDPAYVGLVASTGVYPCPRCAPDLFIQWENGCFKRFHRPCDLCRYHRSQRKDHTSA